MSPYIFAVTEGRNTFLYYRKCPTYVKGGSDGCKREAVGNGERCGKEDRAVVLVSLGVEALKEELELMI